ncbi:unnamed protein product [Symbiodinium sp. KB8]|nr:unnamed protein product [Symbiodinium sp. KB8]
MAKQMWKRAAGWRDKEFYPWLLQTSALLGCTGALVICGCIFVPGLGWKIAVGAGGTPMLCLGWLLSMLRFGLKVQNLVPGFLG